MKTHKQALKEERTKYTKLDVGLKMLKEAIENEDLTVAQMDMRDLEAIERLEKLIAAHIEGLDEVAKGA